MIEQSWSDFIQSEDGVEDAPCIKVVDFQGRTLFYAITRPAQGMIARIEGICSQIDASREGMVHTDPTEQRVLDQNLVDGAVADATPQQVAEASARLGLVLATKVVAETPSA
jgi:hypothetical protein